MTDENKEVNQDMYCPFCDDNGYDPIGLKNHLERHCEAYAEVETIVQERARKKLTPPGCICAQGVIKCPQHGHQPAKRGYCPLCKAVLGYCPQGVYCTSDKCKYVS